jgi:hypothetical protein
MAIQVKETFRQFLPGAGRDTLGNPVQGKTRVVGNIYVSSYLGGEGEPLPATKLGLSSINSITMRVGEEISGAMSSGAAHTRGVVYAKSTAHFYLFNCATAGDLTGYAKGGTETIEYTAEGDSSYDVELT